MKVTDANERATKGYDDKKEFTCVCCGKKVMLTKFASAKTAKCPECKSAGKQADPSLVPTQQTKVRAEISGNTKVLPCVSCGTMTEVSKFMSAAKVLCDKCKGNGEMPSKLKIDVSKVNRDTMPSIEDYTVLPSNIANKNLRDVKCPACGEPHMRILNILDYSSFGLVIHYQCNRCKLLVSVSEQCKFKCRTQKMGSLYDYSGREIENLMGAVESARTHNTISRLYNIIKEHNIEVEGDELPYYLYEEDRPVPIGYIIPDGDKEIKTVHDAINLLKDIKFKLTHTDDDIDNTIDPSGITDSITALEGLFKQGD